MTDEAVQISITIRVAKREQRIERTIKIEELEETIQGIAIETGQEAFGQGAWGCGAVSRRGCHGIGCSAGGCFSRKFGQTASAFSQRV